MSHPVFHYFDNHATTRIAPEVVDAMIPFLQDGWANRSSAYRIASEVQKAVESDGSINPSNVPMAMGLTPMRARSCIRLSLGVCNTEADVDHPLKHLPPIIQKLCDISPLNPAHPDNEQYDIEAARAKNEQELAEATRQEDERAVPA